ncbi:S-layer homology domain-containing protein [Candidatus Peregrinibacteria bacterium]|nr:S-layer homology domain-containing protein [Candidatus Peregrinibacteria bacterium]
MNKKFVQAIVSVSFFALLIGVSQMSYANESSSGNGYNTPIYASELDFTAELNGDQVVTRWAPYAPEGFNYYKVVRSTKNANPVYPDDGYIRMDSDPTANSYTDKDVPSGTVYYRVCSIASPNRYCSRVIEINSDGSSSVVTEKPDDTPKPELYSTTIEPATLSLVAEMKSDGIGLTWEIDGESPRGFKIAISTVHENPTYPVMSGDAYRYFDDASMRSYVDLRVQASKTYHYRVCQYDGNGTCLAYSNAVSVTVPQDFLGKTLDVNPEKAAAQKATADKSVFPDSREHKYYEAINYLREQSVVQGYDDGTFRPDQTINRAEFMKIVIAAKFSQEYITISLAGNCFSDVKYDQWFAPYICMAKNEGIVSGYPDGTFGPAKDISFVEAAKILAEVYNLDFTQGESWYEGYVQALQDNNYIPDTVTNLSKDITRAEMAELIWRIKMQKRQQSHATLLGGNAGSQTSTGSGTIEGWATYYGDGFTVQHPGWYQGSKWGWDLLTDEKDFIDNINVPNYMDVDSYISLYTVGGSDLNTSVYFEHPLTSSAELTINGIRALKRTYRAPRGTTVNGRVTGENENITIYTYALDGKVAVLQYFNAYGSENYNVETFNKIAETFVVR